MRISCGYFTSCKDCLVTVPIRSEVRGIALPPNSGNPAHPFLRNEPLPLVHRIFRPHKMFLLPRPLSASSGRLKSRVPSLRHAYVRDKTHSAHLPTQRCDQNLPALIASPTLFHPFANSTSSLFSIRHWCALKNGFAPLAAVELLRKGRRLQERSSCCRRTGPFNHQELAKQVHPRAAVAAHAYAIRVSRVHLGHRPLPCSPKVR